MRKSFFLILVCALLLPLQVWALGFEAAVGMGRQVPDGTLGYDPLFSSDEIDLKDDADVDTEQRVYGRLILDMPLLIPNIYLMVTPMEFSGTGQKSLSFKFGDKVFDANTEFNSKVRLDQYDVALFYGIPLLETATLETFNVDIGLNLKYVDYRAEVTGTESTTGLLVTESDSQKLPIPMLFLAAQVRPVDWLSLEAEGRGVAYSDNRLLDIIGRVKIKPSLSPVFITAGWRHEYLRLDEYDIKADVTVDGPFVEAGVQF